MTQIGTVEHSPRKTNPVRKSSSHQDGTKWEPVPEQSRHFEQVKEKMGCIYLSVKVKGSSYIGVIEYDSRWLENVKNNEYVLVCEYWASAARVCGNLTF